MDFVAGWISGCAGVLVGHPFDTVKVRLQTQDAANPKYRGTVHCFTTILRAESMAGLFRGMASPLAGVSAVNAVLFGVYGTTRKLFADSDALSTHFFAGMLAGGVQSFITSPMELVKTRLQLQDETSKPIRALQTYKMAATPRYSGPIDCTRQIFLHEGGFRGLSRGLGTTLLRDAPALGVYFASYEFFYRLACGRAMTTSARRDTAATGDDDGCNDSSSSSSRSSGSSSISPSHEPSTGAILMAGGLAGVASWLLCYPIDVVKSRIQGSADAAAVGFVEMAKRMYRQGGVQSYFSGVNVAVIRAYPTNAAIFFTADFIHSLYGRYTAGKAKLIAVEERLVESVHQQMYHHHHQHHHHHHHHHQHLYHHYLGERMHLHTISNHL